MKLEPPAEDIKGRINRWETERAKRRDEWLRKGHSLGVRNEKMAKMLGLKVDTVTHHLTRMGLYQTRYKGPPNLRSIGVRFGSCYAAYHKLDREMANKLVDEAIKRRMQLCDLLMQVYVEARGGNNGGQETTKPNR